MVDMTFIRRMRNFGIFEEIDIQFAAFIKDYSVKEEAAHCAAVVSRELGMGHVCCDLNNETQLEPYTASGVLPDVHKMMINLSRESEVVGSPGDFTPLILDGSRLYLHRYWRYEQRIVDYIVTALQETISPHTLDNQFIRELFPTGSDTEKTGSDTKQRQQLQCAACVSAHSARFSVMSGGPGTGKTWTLVRILRSMVHHTPDIRIALAAPTGKAASRINETIRNDPGFRIPEVGEAQTLHRLLAYGANRDGSGYNVDNPLPYDVVVIDEASMVDVAMMAQCVDALAPHAKLLLVGDRNQLASVEAGSILADICTALGPNCFTHAFEEFCNSCIDNPAAYIRSSCSHAQVGSQKSADRVIQLYRNYRFSLQSGIARVARLIAEGEEEAMESAINIMQETESDCVFKETPDSVDAILAGENVVAKYEQFIHGRDPSHVLRQMARFGILAPVKNGPFGVTAINRSVERMLASYYGIRCDEDYYDHRPLLVTRNDYTLGLFNGDIGVILSSGEGGRPHAYFLRSPEGMMPVIPALLPHDIETVFAMTVHKSQGSEFDEVVLILPDRDTPVLTRELIYTAITRARKKVTIYGTKDILRAALRRRVARSSGLAHQIRKKMI